MTVDEIAELIKTTKDRKAVARLQTCMMCKMNDPAPKISKVLGVPYPTIDGWITRIMKGGIDAVYDKRQPGARPRLSKEQKNQLREDLLKSPQEFGFASGLWTGPMIQRHIEKKFHVKYVLRTVEYLMHAMDFTYRKPRPVHPNAPDNEDKEVFKKKAQVWSDEAHDEGRIILCADERHCRLKQTPGRGWLPKFVRVTMPAPTANREKMTIIGALSMENFYMGFYESGNMISFEKFLRKLYKDIGPFLMFADNVSYHSKKLVQRLYEETDGGIKVEFLPPRSPELNPVETQWREQSRHTSGVYFDVMASLKRFLRKGHRQNTIKRVKLHDYYIPTKLKAEYLGN